MVRILSLIMALMLIVCLISYGVFKTEKWTFDVDACLKEADKLVAEGKLEEAVTLLESGIQKAEDPKQLEVSLERVQSMIADAALPEPEPSDDQTEEEPDNSQSTTSGTQVPSGSTQSESLLSSFQRGDVYTINIFLSNFSEQNFKSYPCDDYALVNFAHLFTRINNPGAEGFGDQGYYVTEDNVNQVLNRFFGRSVNGAQLAPDGFMSYSDGKFYFVPATGESHAYCSVVDSVVDHGDGTYTVGFDVYAHEDIGAPMSPYYGYTAAQAENSNDLVYRYSGTAVVREYVHSDGSTSYRLISYKR